MHRDTIMEAIVRIAHGLPNAKIALLIIKLYEINVINPTKTSLED